MTVSRSWLTLGVIPALLLGLMILPLVLYWGDLPNPLATHWGFNGEPNGSMPPIALLLVVTVLYVAIYWSVTRVLARTPYEAPSFIAGLFFLGALLAGVVWMAVLANRNQASWESADRVGLIQILIVVGVAGAIGLAGWRLAGGKSSERAPAPEATPVLDVAQPDAAIWSSRGNGWVLQVAGLAILAAALVFWNGASFVLFLVGLLILAFAEVRATVSHRGVVISLGWLGMPSWTVPMAAISRAEVETVDAMAYGGWGYRLGPGVRALVTRGGEALRLVRPDKPDLVLTVDEAATGAGLINSILGVTKP
jgi:hypothetical protein